MTPGRRPPGSQHAPVVVVVGASSGIGRATAQAFARRGARLVLAARSEESLRAAQRACQALGAPTTVVPTDVRDPAAVEALVAATVARHGRIDVWVQSVAVVAYGRFVDVPAEVFDAVVQTNVVGTTNTARAVLPQLRAQGAGTFVLVGSLLGKIATPYLSSYVMSKWALRGLVRCLALETRDVPDVHICMVSPGSVNTPVYTQAANYAGRVGRPPPPVDPPEKVARAVLRAVDHPRRRDVSVGVANPVVVLGFTALPRVYDALVGRLMGVGGLSREPVAPHRGNVVDPQPAGDALHGRHGRHWLRGVGAGAAVAAATLAVGARRR